MVTITPYSMSVSYTHLDVYKRQSPMYIPPFTISVNAINLIAEISAQIERYAIRLEQKMCIRDRI